MDMLHSFSAGMHRRHTLRLRARSESLLITVGIQSVITSFWLWNDTSYSCEISVAPPEISQGSKKLYNNQHAMACWCSPLMRTLIWCLQVDWLYTSFKKQQQQQFLNLRNIEYIVSARKSKIENTTAGCGPLWLPPTGSPESHHWTVKTLSTWFLCIFDAGDILNTILFQISYSKIQKYKKEMR